MPTDMRGARKRTEPTGLMTAKAIRAFAAGGVTAAGLVYLLHRHKALGLKAELNAAERRAVAEHAKELKAQLNAAERRAAADHARVLKAQLNAAEERATADHAKMLKRALWEAQEEKKRYVVSALKQRDDYDRGVMDDVLRTHRAVVNKKNINIQRLTKEQGEVRSMFEKLPKQAQNVERQRNRLLAAYDPMYRRNLTAFTD